MSCFIAAAAPGIYGSHWFHRHFSVGEDLFQVRVGFGGMGGGVRRRTGWCWFTDLPGRLPTPL
ncbi:hypothetical protein ACFLWS_01065 [Chloroflexota bacterium]